MENWTIKIVDVGYRFAQDIFIYRRNSAGKVEMLHGDIVDTIDDMGIAPKPSLILDKQGLQALADALANIGIKPQEGFLEGKLQATETHLKDMRTLLKLK